MCRSHSIPSLVSASIKIVSSSGAAFQANPQPAGNFAGDGDESSGKAVFGAEFVGCHSLCCCVKCNDESRLFLSKHS